MKIFIIDDHTLFCQSLTNMLEMHKEFEVIGVETDGLKAIHGVQKLKPEMVILDLQLNNSSGLEIASMIRNTYPEIKIVILTAYDNEVDVRRASDLGVNGFLLKSIDPKDFINYLKDIYKGEYRVSTEIAGIMFNKLNKMMNNDILTEREIEIVKKINEGYSYKEIAKQLYVSINTVKNHVKNIFRKLEVDNKVQVVTKALEYKLINSTFAETNNRSCPEKARVNRCSNNQSAR
jgi:two-component system nitrate/nitrite response regulator NarL